MRTKIEAYVDEKSFKNEKGENINFLSLVIPVTETAEKNIKVEQFVLQLARDRANNPTNLFKK